MSEKKDHDPFGDERDDEDFDFTWEEDETIGRLPGDDFYDADLVDDDFEDPDAGLTPEQAASRRAMLGVPSELPEEARSLTRALQDTLINELNEILIEEEWRWRDAAELAFQALLIDPTYPRAANALVRCYLTHATLDDMQRIMMRKFHPEKEMPNLTRRMLAHSYIALTHADVDWPHEVPEELADVADEIKRAQRALRDAFYMGDKDATPIARAEFKAAIKRSKDQRAMLWYATRAYATMAYFAESAALLGSLLSSENAHQDVHRLHAEMTWWRDHGRRLPWIH